MWLLLILALTGQQPTTTPSSIVKVPRATAVCQFKSGTTDLTAGVTYNLIFYVDAIHRYKTLQVFLHEPFGVTHTWGQTVSDTEALCPVGSANENQRPHIMPLTVMVPGFYRLEAVIANDPTVSVGSLRDGVVIDSFMITVR